MNWIKMEWKLFRVADTCSFWRRFVVKWHMKYIIELNTVQMKDALLHHTNANTIFASVHAFSFLLIFNLNKLAASSLKAASHS